MAYNHGREDRKWRIWKEAEEKLLRECGVDEATIEQIRMADRADFNSNRRFYRWTNDVAEYLEDMAGRERQAEVGTVAELLEEIESENLYQVLVTVDGRTLKIVLLKMQGYSTKVRDSWAMRPGDDKRWILNIAATERAAFCLYRTTWRDAPCKCTGTPHSKRLGRGNKVSV